MKCTCEVCRALDGLPRHLREGDGKEVARHLPRQVRKVLAAQGRVLGGTPRPGDKEIVQQAALKCTAARLHPEPGIH